MKNFVLPPVKDQKLSSLGTAGYYCLAHLYLQHETYREFFHARKNEGNFILLDNSAAEKSLVTEDILLDICEQLLPDEVIPPDVLFDQIQTEQNLLSFIEKMKERNLFGKGVKIFFCPQGTIRQEWIQSYMFGLSNEHVSTIGLSKIAVPKCWAQEVDDQGIDEARNECIQYLSDSDLIQKPLHLLGMGGPMEYAYYTQLPIPQQKLLRSTDSCYSVLAATEGLSWENGQFERIKTPHHYFEYPTLTTPQIELAKSNVAFLQDIISKIAE